MEDFEDDEETVWRGTKVPELENLESTLRCAICQEFLTTPMMFASCAHNFCSVCVRRWLQGKTECPTCREKQTENNLVFNRSIDLIVKIFKRERKKMLHLLSATGSEKGELRVGNEEEKFKPGFNKLEMMQSGSDRNGLGSNSVSKATIEKNSEMETLNPTVPPITCFPSIQATIPAPKVTAQTRNRLPKLVYHIMKMNQLKELVKAIKMSTDGDRQTLTFRHSEYTLLYNAALDAVNSSGICHQNLEKTIRKKVRENERSMFAASKRGKSSHRPLSFQPFGGKMNNLPLKGTLATELSSAQNFKKLRAQIQKRKKNKSKNKKKTEKMNIDEHHVLNWRTVLSTRCKRPFYFNTETGKGQFEIPAILREGSNERSSTLSIKGYGSKKTMLVNHQVIKGESQRSIETPRKHSESVLNSKTTMKVQSWSCPTCTFINECLEDKCEVCLKPKPIATRSKRRRITVNN